MENITNTEDPKPNFDDMHIKHNVYSIWGTNTLYSIVILLVIMNVVTVASGNGDLYDIVSIAIFAFVSALAYAIQSFYAVAFYKLKTNNKLHNWIIYSTWSAIPFVPLILSIVWMLKNRHKIKA